MSSIPGVNGIPVVMVVSAAAGVTACGFVKTCAAVPAELQPASSIALATNTVSIRKKRIFITVSFNLCTALYKYTENHPKHCIYPI
jgi:hypothetical protein